MTCGHHMEPGNKLNSWRYDTSLKCSEFIMKAVRYRLKKVTLDSPRGHLTEINITVAENDEMLCVFMSRDYECHTFL